MNSAKLLKEIETTKQRWSKEAFQIVVEEARRILDESPNDLSEFVMGMGSYTFKAKKGGIYDTDLFSEEEYDDYDKIRMNSIGHMEEDFAPEFRELVEELDEETGVTGQPVRLKSGMEAVYAWGDTQKTPVSYKPLK